MGEALHAILIAVSLVFGSMTIGSILYVVIRDALMRDRLKH